MWIKTLLSTSPNILPTIYEKWLLNKLYIVIQVWERLKIPILMLDFQLDMLIKIYEFNILVKTYPQYI